MESNLIITQTKEFSVRAWSAALGILLSSAVWSAVAAPEGFVDLRSRVPGVILELRYATDNNFVGRPLIGYETTEKTWISSPAAEALARVQADLARFGLGLKVFDAYRPQRAVNQLVHWATDVTDDRKKSEYYPEVDKRDLFKLQYIASRSGHSRGSTVDLTLVSLDDGAELDMGSDFDFFGVQSWPEHAALSAQQRANRMLLQQTMKRYGFKPYAREWWHFTLAQEPYPDTYFDFIIQAAEPGESSAPKTTRKSTP